MTSTRTGTDRHSVRQPAGGRSGQAALEFISGLLLLLLVVAGILHVSRMGTTSLFLHSVLRGDAGESAMEGVVSSSPEYVSDWQAGPDGARYTADDEAVRNGLMLPSTLACLTDHSVARPSDWLYVEADSRLPVSMVRLEQSPSMAAALGFAHREETLHVPVDTVIRQLAYDKDEVAIKESVWMPLMGGLY